MTAHPHDSLIKANLSDPQEMQGMLKAILPAKIIEQIHWPSLRAEPTTFIDPELRDHYTDLLFSSHF